MIIPINNRVFNIFIWSANAIHTGSMNSVLKPSTAEQYYADKIFQCINHKNCNRFDCLIELNDIRDMNMSIDITKNMQVEKFTEIQTIQTEKNITFQLMRLK